MAVQFRPVSDRATFDRLVAFLTEDVLRSGGSAGEIVNMHGKLMQVTVCKVPWGTLLLRDEMTYLEALRWLQDTG